MPLVRVSLPKGKSAGFRRAVTNGIHQAMVATINIPPDDRFQIITEHAMEDLIITPSYLGIDHTADAVIVNITLRRGRTAEMKKALYARIAENLAADAGLRKEDVIIVLVENDSLDWSFGNGLAPYAT